MKEEWRPIDGFDAYIISTHGRVRSGYSNSEIIQRRNQTGVVSVWLSQDGARYARSLPLLVARHWLPEPEREDFTTPIHLDGNRQNCRVDNLLWRPRWFAIAFHRERLEDPFADWRDPIEIIETGEIFTNPRELSMVYGNLEKDIYFSIVNEKHIFPQWFHARWA